MQNSNAAGMGQSASTCYLDWNLPPNSYVIMDVDWSLISDEGLQQVVTNMVVEIGRMERRGQVWTLTSSSVNRTGSVTLTSYATKNENIYGHQGGSITKNRIELLQLSTKIIEDRSLNRLKTPSAVSIDLSEQWINELRHLILYGDMHLLPAMFGNPRYSLYTYEKNKWSTLTI